MPGKHEPDQRFIEKLEWQLSGELRRRNRSGAPERRGVRMLKIVALVAVSIGLGAGAMGASHQFQESWRKELLETRLAVQLEIAQHRVEAYQETVEQVREEVQQGLRESRDLEQEELQVAQAQSIADFMELTLEEIRESGREPLGEVSSPLVGGRDFASERILMQMRVARLNLDALLKVVERTRSDTASGMADDIDMEGWDLTTRDAELKLAGMAKRLEVRQAYLASEITAVEAELKYLEVEAQNRVVLLDQQRQYYQSEVDRFTELAEAGLRLPSYATRMGTWVAEIEARSRLAEAELGIIQRELEQRASSR